MKSVFIARRILCSSKFGTKQSCFRLICSTGVVKSDSDSAANGISIDPTVTKVWNSTPSSIHGTTPSTGKEWHDWFQNLPPLDAERELHKLKRTIGALHAKGDYTGALDAAERLMTTVSSEMGEDNAIYASCLNNVALMNKLLGEDDIALDHYTRALHIYQDVSGKNHASYASTLSNIGILYRSMAEKASGMERLQLVERAEEALSDSHATRSEMDGTSSRGALSASMNLAMVWRVMDEKERGRRAQECESRLQSCLDSSTAEYGREDTLTATILSNYGLFLKESGRYTDARTAYEEAFNIRSSTLGDVHPDTIVSMHNLAECLLSMGLESESVAIQEKILQTLGHDMADTHGFGGQDLRTKQQEQQEPSSSDDGSARRVVAANKTLSGAAAAAAAAADGDRTVVASLDEDGNVQRQETAPRPIVTYATRPRKNKNKNKKGP